MPAAIPNRIQTQVRIDAEVHGKLKTIAAIESRNMNSQIEYFLKKGIEQFEKENGPISPTE